MIHLLSLRVEPGSGVQLGKLIDRSLLMVRGTNLKVKLKDYLTISRVVIAMGKDCK
jgi:hypothetical protein